MSFSPILLKHNKAASFGSSAMQLEERYAAKKKKSRVTKIRIKKISTLELWHFTCVVSNGLGAVFNGLEVKRKKGKT